MGQAENPRYVLEKWHADPAKGTIQVGDEVWNAAGQIYVVKEYDPRTGAIRLEYTGRRMAMAKPYQGGRVLN